MTLRCSLQATFVAALLALASLPAQTTVFIHVPDDAPAVGGCDSRPFGATSQSRYQTIVPAGELGAAAPITRLGFAFCSTGTRTFTDLEIRMAHLGGAALSTNFDSNLPLGGDLVFSQGSFALSFTAGQWSDIPLMAPFRFNGRDAVVVEIRLNAAAGTTGSVRVGDRERLVANSFNAATGSTNGFAAKMRLTKLQDFMFVSSDTPAVGTCSSEPFARTSSRYQLLIPAADLGQRPSFIRDLGFAACNSGSGTFGSIQVRLAHKASATLGASFDSNLPSGTGTVVLSATNRPFAFVRNQWNDLGLDTPFVYNGRDNLLVDITVIGGPATASFRETSGRHEVWSTNANSPNGTLGTTGLKVRARIEAPNATTVVALVGGCGPIGSGLEIDVGSTRFAGMGRPIIGSTMTFTMRNGPTSGSGGFNLGFIATGLFPFALPGAPGCFLHNDVFTLLPTTFGSNRVSAPASLTIPNSTAYTGLPFYVQGLAIWPGANALGIATSTQAAMLIGI